MSEQISELTEITEIVYQGKIYKLSGSGGGGSGATFTPSVSPEGVISWTNDKQLPNPDPVNIKGPAGQNGSDGRDGVDGEDGVSPVARVERIANGILITITDATGTTIQNLADGVSPSASVEQVEGGARLTITDKDGTTQATLRHGVDGKDLAFKEEIEEYTMLASEWSTGLYSFESDYPHTVYDIEIEPDGDNISVAQYDAWSKAKIVGSPDLNECKALGTVPTVDIPIIIRAIRIGYEFANISEIQDIIDGTWI